MLGIYTTLKGYVGGLGQEVHHQYHAWDLNEFWHIINTRGDLEEEHCNMSKTSQALKRGLMGTKVVAEIDIPIQWWLISVISDMI